MNYISVNHEIVETPASGDPANRGIHHAQGLFETMRIMEGKILLADLHFQRLFAGVKMLELNFPFPATTPAHLSNEILLVCKLNGLENSARVRLTIGIDRNSEDEKNKTRMVIESWVLDKDFSRLNETGLTVDIFPGGRKQQGLLSNLKSNDLIVYREAAKFAKETGVDDCLVLNENDRVADSSIANVFIVKSGAVITPPLTEGCVEGVMRKYILQRLRDENCKVKEQQLSIRDLEMAEEMFLTNAVRGVRWVGQFRGTFFGNRIGSEVAALVV